jgi:hypothetical protein
MLDDLLIAGKEVSREVLDKTLLQYLKPEDRDGVAKAFDYLIRRYRTKNLTRDNGYPAEIHPVNVARTLDFDPHLMKVALLHDMAEEFADEEPEILDEIHSYFGHEVMLAVRELTNHKLNPNLDGKDYKKYISQIKRLDCLLVKEADVLDNVRTSYARKLVVQKNKMPAKVDIFLQHIDKLNPRGKITYKGAFYKYHAKIIEEIFRMYERQLKNIIEQHKAYLRDVMRFEALLVFYYTRYSKRRKEVYKKFLEIITTNHPEMQYHLRIELIKRTKEALITKLPLNSMLISINQHMYLHKIAKKHEPALADALKQSVNQQIKLARVEGIRLINYYSIIIANKKILREDFKHEIPFNYSKVTAVQEAVRKLDEYQARLENE